jgi:hypothetical protein
MSSITPETHNIGNGKSHMLLNLPEEPCLKIPESSFYIA